MARRGQRRLLRGRAGQSARIEAIEDEGTYLALRVDIVDGCGQPSARLRWFGWWFEEGEAGI